MTRPGLSLALASAAVALALSACASSPHDKSIASTPAVTPLDRFRPEVTADVPDQVAIGVHVTGLSENQRLALLDFAARWRDAGDGAPVTVLTPSDGHDLEAARAMGYAVRSFLVAEGRIPSARLQMQPYSGGEAAPILARFPRLTVKRDNCAGGWGNLSSTMDNETYTHFGCSLTANIAAQVADPRDLIAGRPLDPGDAVRRAKQLGQYREGKSTASEKEKQSDGTVSTAVQQ